MNDNDSNNDNTASDSNDEVYDDGDGIDYSEHFTTDRIFTSTMEGFTWAFETALKLGFGIKRASNKRVGRHTSLRQDYFVCRMGGRRPVNNDADSLMRANTVTAWCNCRFQMKLVEIQEGQWKVVMLFGFHNHGLTLYCDGDRYYAKFDEEELAYIDAQVRAHVTPAIISAGLHQRNPEKSRPNRRQIYNRSQKVRVDERDGRNPAQQMLALAVQHKYVHFWVTDRETGELTHVFMAHPEAVKMFRSYYYVVLIDSMYKTNLYGLPLVEMVGVTPVGKTFVIAYALVKHESEDGYRWVLQQLRSLLNDAVQPNAIVTDFEGGLLNAIPTVFPDSYHLLCLWHIYSNVETKALNITGQDSWAKYITSKLFKAVVEAETRDQFNEAWAKLARQFAPVAAYIEDQWIPHLEKWAKYRTNKITHFDNTSTSRVESAHANLKKWLNSAKLAIDSIWIRFHYLLETQHVEIRHLLELSRSRRLTGLHLLFSRISCKVSKNAIIELRGEFERGAKMTEDALITDCGCVKTSTLGLLCDCSLHRISRNGCRVPLDVLHEFWRKLVYDGSEAMPACDDDRLEELFDKIRNADPSMRSSMFDSLYSQIHPDEEDVREPRVNENPRGRPKKATRRKPSAVEHARVRVSLGRGRGRGRGRSTTPQRNSSSQQPTGTPFTTPGSTPTVPGSPFTTPCSTPTSLGTPSTTPRSTQTGLGTPSSTTATTSTGSFSTSHCAPLEVNYVIGHSRYFPYLEFLPSWFTQYLEAWFDPSPDGHCGYRVISHALRGDQTHFTMARTDLLREIRSSATYRDAIYGANRFDSDVGRITFMDQVPCGMRNWMDNFDLYGYATMYNWVICCVSSFVDPEGQRHWGSSHTFLPLRAPTGVRAPYGVLWILHAGNHFLRLRVRPLSPMPPIASCWEHDGSVAHYRDNYRHQLSMWRSFEPRR